MNKIIIDGKEYELSDELAEKIKAEVAQQEIERMIADDPFARMCSDSYHFISVEGKIYTSRETGAMFDGELYSVANYCRDKELMEQRALHETLNRLLWRYSETHGGGEKHGGYGGFFIYKSGGGGMFVGHCTYVGCGDVYFKTRAVGEAAIEEVVKPFMAAHPEFVW